MYSLQTRIVCGPARRGEAYPSQGIFLRNAVSLESLEDIRAKRIDWIVLESRVVHPYAPVSASAHEHFLDACNLQLASRFGPPIYEDRYLKAYKVEAARL